jgi:hypothetical protein
MMNMAVHRLTKVIQNLRRTTLADEARVSDGQLLDQFIERQDESAFAALVQRHSPMVWGVCTWKPGERSETIEEQFMETLQIKPLETGCDQLITPDSGLPPAGFEPATYGLGNRCSIP